jgi:hypothetical protein
MGELRLLPYRTFDPAGTFYADGPVKPRKRTGPASPAEKLGAVDAVLLSHAQRDEGSISLVFSSMAAGDLPAGHDIASFGEDVTVPALALGPT